MNNQKGISSIVIILILAVIVGTGILTWQYFGASEKETVGPEGKITEKKVPISAAAGEEGWKPPEITVKVREKVGEYNTIVMDKYLGYEIDYPESWEIFAESGLIRGFGKSFEKDSEEIRCSINIVPMAREANLWTKPCEETQTDYYSRYYKPWKIETSEVIVGDSSTLKLTKADLPGNVKYSFGPNPNTSGKWCFEIELATEKPGEYDPESQTWITLDERGIVVPECEEILNHVIPSFKFIELAEEEESYVKVISPNGGESWTVGQSYKAIWESVGIDEVDIYLYSAGAAGCRTFAKLAEDTPASLGEYSVTIPSDMCESGNYRMQVWLPDTFEVPQAGEIEPKEGLLDESDNYFSVGKFLGQSTFISPKGMEQWKIGENHIIEISQPVKDFTPFTHLTLNKSNKEEVGIISCKIGGSGETIFDWDTKDLLNYCGAGLEGKTKAVGSGTYMVAITKDVEGRPIIVSSDLFSIVSE